MYTSQITNIIMVIKSRIVGDKSCSRQGALYMHKIRVGKPEVKRLLVRKVVAIFV
jgi:hypothetical protein